MKTVPTFTWKQLHNKTGRIFYSEDIPTSVGKMQGHPVMKMISFLAEDGITYVIGQEFTYPESVDRDRGK